ncbi:histidine phosphatase family protein [Fibrobacter sp. UWB11]|uniref:histidine phosphatase family protein n=1 Tax=Fibrobacter sp. UWB11 TaxID=1896202 RepID=UPI0009273137|nr:histidine phosphatase family protein [Fibrobacter sp. UWB11]SIO28463.1 Broad specificity phosphatase PhoE [Fibrobacter sp. UWB11]
MQKLNHSVLLAIAAKPLFVAIAYTAMLSACSDTTSSTAPESIASSSTTTIEYLSSSETTTIESSSSALFDSTGSAPSTGSNSSAIQQSSSSSGQKEFSSSSRNSHRRSSSSVAQTSSSAISSSQATPVSSAKEASSSSTTPSPVKITLDENGFATVADVYRSLQDNEKAVFIIRHSEREDNVAIETELTANGVKMAQDLGATLKSDEEFSYITSGFVRTNETANNISKGRGEASLPKLITNYDITGNWFLKISADSLAQYATKLNMKGSSVELMAHWAYDGGYPDALYELSPRSEEFMQKVILKNLSKWKRVSIMVSHDILVMPLAVFGSDKKVALKYHEDYHWINYIAGLAIIIGKENNLRYVPVKGADSGVIDYLAIYMEEHGTGSKKPSTPKK